MAGSTGRGNPGGPAQGVEPLRDDPPGPGAVTETEGNGTLETDGKVVLTDRTEPPTGGTDCNDPTKGKPALMGIEVEGKPDNTSERSGDPEPGNGGELIGPTGENPGEAKESHATSSFVRIVSGTEKTFCSSNKGLERDGAVIVAAGGGGGGRGPINGEESRAAPDPGSEDGLEVRPLG